MLLWDPASTLPYVWAWPNDWPWEKNSLKMCFLKWARRPSPTVSSNGELQLLAAAIHRVCIVAGWFPPNCGGGRGEHWHPETELNPATDPKPELAPSTNPKPEPTPTMNPPLAERILQCLPGAWASRQGWSGAKARCHVHPCWSFDGLVVTRTISHPTAHPSMPPCSIGFIQLPAPACSTQFPRSTSSAGRAQLPSSFIYSGSADLLAPSSSLDPSSFLAHSSLLIFLFLCWFHPVPWLHLGLTGSQLLLDPQIPSFTLVFRA